ncbi:MAG: hypothetical protein LIP28_05255 [Deltaproteobacteria bacterium]|nr:hypothetical protein [Deltaproteobacteria bacterium]
MHSYKVRKNVPKGDILAGWGEKFGLNVNWLLWGEGEMFRTATPAIGDDSGFASLREEVALLRERNADLKELVALQKEMIADLKESYRILRESVQAYAKQAEPERDALREEQAPYKKTPLQEDGARYLVKK